MKQGQHMTTLDLIKIRRDLHKIPELALHETQTHAYLKNVVETFKTDFMTIREIPEVPTALLVRLAGTNPTRTIGIAPISMPCQSPKRRDCRLPQQMKV